MNFWGQTKSADSCNLSKKDTLEDMKGNWIFKVTYFPDVTESFLGRRQLAKAHAKEPRTVLKYYSEKVARKET
jgi:hypothetical protein